jgi:putative ABC transport system ATP-binding protein
MAAELFLRAQDLHKEYLQGSKCLAVLRGIDLEVRRGEFLAIMGPSGSGKSTLLNLLGGLDKPTSGSIFVDEVEITALDQDALCQYRRNRVGFIFQSFNLLGTMTARQNVEFPMIFSGVAPAERQRRAGELLDAVGLSDRRHHKPSELSGGEQQRVAIARAMTNAPDLLLADEPTGNLDSATGVDVMQQISRLHADGRTVIIVTHDDRVAQYAGRTLRMLDGSWVEPARSAS